MEDSSAWARFHHWGSGFSPTSAVMFITFLVVFLTGFVFFYSFIDSLLWKLQTKRSGQPPVPPGTLGYPILGEMIPYFKNRTAFCAERHERYGPVFKSRLFGTTVFLKPPAGNKFVFQNDQKLVDVGWPMSTVKLLGIHSLPTQVGSAHKLSRRHMLPFLNPLALEQYVPRIEAHLRYHFKEFWKGSEGLYDGQEFEIPIGVSMKLVTFSVIADLVLSMQPDETEGLCQLYAEWMKGFATFPIYIPGTRYYCALTARARIQKILGNAMAKRRDELKKGKASPTQDFLSYVLTQPDESGRLISNEEIEDKILLLLFAGYETSASALAMTFRNLALYPEICQRLKDEHAAIAKRKSDGQGLTKEDLSAMKYTWWVIQETMRLQAVVPGGFRKAVEDFEYGGYLIPKGWMVMWSATSHTDLKYFNHPEVFDPTRFDGSKTILPYTYVPFGGGPHMCLGYEYARMEMLIIIYHVMKKYSFTLVDPDEPFPFALFPQQKSGTLMRVKKLSAGQ